MKNSSIITIDNFLFLKVLKHNLLNISHMCDKEYFIMFDTLNYIIEHKNDKEKIFKSSMTNNIYMLIIDHVLNSGTKYLVT